MTDHVKTLGMFLYCALCLLLAFLVEAAAQVVYRLGWKFRGKRLMGMADYLWDTALRTGVWD